MSNISRKSGASRATIVFVSFSSADTVLAQGMVRQIEATGARTFFAPRDIAGGENFANRIVQGIGESDTVLFLLSRAAIESPHVRREVALAIDERRRLLPVALPGIEFPQDFPTEWTYWLSAVQVHRFRSVDELTALAVGPGTSSATHRPSRPTEPTRVERAEPRDAEPASPVVLLRAERRVVPFSGREADLSRLDAWLERSDQVSVRLIAAAAGEGKSRLADEFAAGAEAKGWQTERLRDGWRPQDMPAERSLLIVDYAETKTRVLTELLSRLSHSAVNGPIRVLLLARSAGDWWRGLSSVSPEVEDVLADATVHTLAPLRDDPAAATALYADAVAAFAAAMNVEPPANPEVPEFHDSLLDLLQRALLSVLADTEEGAPDRVVARLLGHERRYVRAAADADLDGFDNMDFERVAVLFSLFPPREEAEGIALAALAQPTATPVELRKLARLFRRLYPSETYYSSGLKPDAVAERALAGLIEEDGAIPGGLATWHRADAVQLEMGLRLVARSAALAASARTELGRLVPTLDLDALAIAVRVALQIEAPQALILAIQDAVVAGAFDEHLGALLELLPEETVALAEMAAVVAQRLLTTPAADHASAAAEGRLLLDASNRFSDAGWSERALEAATDGIAALRSDGSGESAGPLFSALSNLSNRLWETGDLDDALDAAREAIAERPANADPIDLVAARNNLAFRAIELGHYDEAAAELAEALAVGGSAAEVSTRARVRMKAVESNDVCLMSALGKWDRAVQLSTALLAERRIDYAQQRDRNIAYLARSLANAALPLAATGDSRSARALIAEARSLHRITALKAPIFRFEAAEGDLIDAIICLLDGDSSGASAAADAARLDLDNTDAPLGRLASRLSTAINVAATAAREATDGHPVALDRLYAIGTQPLADGVAFPLLLEYKDL